MTVIISRPPYDDFSYGLFLELLRFMPDNGYEAYYFWTNPPEHFKNFCNVKRFNKSLVILGIKDLVDLWLEYDFWQDTQQAGTKILAQCFSRHPGQHFVVLTSLENLQKELNLPNVSIVSWGGDITNQRQKYPMLEPVLDKNFDSTKSFVCLNRHPRAHRLVLLSYLLGRDLDQHGLISCLAQNELTNDLLDRISWQFEPWHDKQRSIILDGYKKLQNRADLMIDQFDIYQSVSNDNVTNFTDSLSHKYRDSFVELVSETSFSEPAFNLTEKTLNSIYGCNFPIMFCSAGAVAHLREVGFDMFDDVIDHSYDQVANPLDRIMMAIDTNLEILTDVVYAKQQWNRCRERFISNIDVAKNIYSYYADRARDQFQKSLAA